MSESKPESEPMATPPNKLREIGSAEIFQGDRLVVINHAGEQYRLTITRNDKLILQK